MESCGRISWAARRVIAIVSLFLVMVCDCYLLWLYKKAFGSTDMFYLLVGMGFTVGYATLYSMYRELVTGVSWAYKSSTQIKLLFLQALTEYLLLKGSLSESMVFFIVVITYVYLISCVGSWSNNQGVYYRHNTFGMNDYYSSLHNAEKVDYVHKKSGDKPISTESKEETLNEGNEE